ncbi:Gfo/Idh/MocA family oxidoreductase [bacterium]|nr:Gfo/Idh/MocA family oxidoreductase [bacterium]
MGISIGLVGLGDFGSQFAELFTHHPLVDRVGLCDREPDRIRKFADRPDFKAKFSPKDAYASLDDICKSDLDALVIITQHWLHTPQAIQAMNAGKHVYSAVPLISIPDHHEILDWCNKLVETVKRTGALYMYGETTYYRPQAMFCRRKAAEGAFGDFVYAEGEYFHDVDSWCNLRNVSKHRMASTAGAEWREKMKTYTGSRGKGGPMLYPTHSTCGPVSVMKAHAKKVTAYGYRNRTGDPYFADSAFSNEIALYRMSNGAVVRICECREVANKLGNDEETFRVMGTRGTFSENTWSVNFREKDFSPAKPPEVKRMKDEELRDPLPPDVLKAWTSTKKESDVYGGHGGSHAHLVHEFVDAIAHKRQPAITAWDAVRYTAMGAMAHESALRDGETLDVPDWGDPPGR